jgi:hypothetical protein
MLDFKSICALAKCNRRLKGDAESRFALATQDQFSIVSNVAESAGLLQYHPKIHIKGPWHTFKCLPDAVIRNVVACATGLPIGLAKGKDLEEVLISARRLRKLSLSDGVISDDTVVRLFEVLNERESVAGVSGLQTLHLVNMMFRKETMTALAIYVANTNSLEEFAVRYCTITFEGGCLNNLADGLIKNRTIKSLDLTGSCLKNPELALSRILRGCPTLHVLNMFSTYTRPSILQFGVIVDAILDNNCNLRSLDIGNHRINRNDVVAIAPVITKLCRFEARYTDICDIGLRAIGEAIGASKTITHIDLSNNEELEDNLEIFSSALATNTSMQVLSLNRCRIHAEGLLHLKGALVGKSELRELHLAGNNIDDVGCQYVAEILASCPALEFLNLASNRVRSAGVVAIASALPLAKRLQRIRLDWNEVVDDASSASLFAAAHDHPSLSCIVITASNDRFQIGELARAQLETLKNPDIVKKS